MALKRKIEFIRVFLLKDTPNNKKKKSQVKILLSRDLKTRVSQCSGDPRPEPCSAAGSVVLKVFPDKHFPGLQWQRYCPRKRLAKSLTLLFSPAASAVQATSPQIRVLAVSRGRSWINQESSVKSTAEDPVSLDSQSPSAAQEI